MQNEYFPILNEVIRTMTDTQGKLINFLANGGSVKIEISEYMNCYNAINKITNNKKKEDQVELFRWFTDQIKEYVRKYIYEKLAGKEDEIFMDTLIKEWNNFKVYLHWMSLLMKLFNKSFEGTQKKSCQGESFYILRTYVFDKIQDKLIKILIKYIEDERNDQQVPGNKIQEIFGYIVDLGYGERAEMDKYTEEGTTQFTKFKYQLGTKNLTQSEKEKPIYDYYEKYFEKDLLEKTQIFYKNKGVLWLQMRASEYVSNSLKYIYCEEKIVHSYYKQSKAKYFQVIDKQLVDLNAEQIVKKEGSGILEMLRNNKIEELVQLYKLFSRVPETYKWIADRIGNYINNEGKGYNTEEKLLKDPLGYVGKVIIFKNKMDDVVSKKLDNQILFQNSRDSSFRDFLNTFENSAKFLAIHCDNQLKKDMKGLNEDEIDKRITDIMNIFFYLYSKDAFITHYQKFLQKRLLSGHSISDEYEEKLITRLKQEAGNTHVQRLQQMCSDIRLSKNEIQPEFQSYYIIDYILLNSISHKSKRGHSKIDFNVTILTKSFWQFNLENLLQVPVELDFQRQQFENYYKDKHKQGRELVWLMREGNNEMYANFGEKFDKRYQLLVSGLQMIILLEFNKANDSSVQKLIENLKSNENDVKIAIMGLLRPNKQKIGVLKRRSDNGELNINEKLEVNTEFQSNQVRINCLPSKEILKSINSAMPEDDKEEQEELKKQRNNILDACIVRIMKGRRKLKHSSLQEEVIKLTTLFKPKFPQIKERIQSLIERDYLKRNDQDRECYEYIP